MDLLLNRRRAMLSALEVEEYIIFADPVVEQICANQWGDGIGLKPSQAAKVTSLADVFKGNTTITSFDELQYFTSLTALGTSATITQNTHSQFFGCKALTSITFPPSLTMIGSYSFYGCTSLSNISGLESVTVLGREAFVSCKSLSIEVNLPNLTAIYDGAFKLSAITKVLSLGSITALTCSRDYGVFQSCTALTSVVLPNTLTNIQQYAFYGCTALTTVGSLGNITNIGTSAFENCTHLTTVVSLASLVTVGGNAFWKCSALNDELSCPNLTGSVANNTFRETKITKVLNLGRITSIGAYGFARCNSMTEIHLPPTLSFVGNNAFRDCANLVLSSLPASITSIGTDAFSGCSKLTGDINLPNLTSISGGAFNNSKITSISNLGSITNTGGWYTFSSRTLVSVVLPATLTTVSTRSFSNCTVLTTVTCLATTPPAYSGSEGMFVGTVTNIYVPADSVEEYQAADGWSRYKSKISAIPEE